jgi:hypothetical protein
MRAGRSRTVLFRTARDRSLDEDLRTGITGAEYKVAFEIDDIDLPGRQERGPRVRRHVHPYHDGARA